jgi:hypothetical protein
MLNALLSLLAVVVEDFRSLDATPSSSCKETQYAG